MADNVFVLLMGKRSPMQFVDSCDVAELVNDMAGI